MKSTSYKFDYHRFADSLIDRGLVEREAIQHVLQQCEATGSLLPEILVTEGMVSDWEVSRVASELYHLPYLPVETYPPATEVLEGLDSEYLRQYGLVPLDRLGTLLTVAMPGIVPARVLDGLRHGDNDHILPVVGSVSSNRRWLNENLPESQLPGLDQIAAALPGGDDLEVGDWAEIFDAGDQAVNLELQGGSPLEPEQQPSLEVTLDPVLDEPGDEPVE